MGSRSEKREERIVEYCMKQWFGSLRSGCEVDAIREWRVEVECK